MTGGRRASVLFQTFRRLQFRVRGWMRLLRFAGCVSNLGWPQAKFPQPMFIVLVRRVVFSTSDVQAFVNGQFIGGCQEISNLHSRGWTKTA